MVAQALACESLFSILLDGKRDIIMRFLSIYKTSERGVPPTPEEMAKMGKLIEDGMKAGYLLAVEG